MPRAAHDGRQVLLEGVRDGEGTVRVNGSPVKLPDHDWLTEVPIDPKLLEPATTLPTVAPGLGART